MSQKLHFTVKIIPIKLLGIEIGIEWQKRNEGGNEMEYYLTEIIRILKRIKRTDALRYIYKIVSDIDADINGSAS